MTLERRAPRRNPNSPSTQSLARTSWSMRRLDSVDAYGDLQDFGRPVRHGGSCTTNRGGQEKSSFQYDEGASARAEPFVIDPDFALATGHHAGP